MWRAICVLILLPSLTAAQTQGLAPNTIAVPPTHQTKSRPPSPPAYRQYTYYSEIRQGTKEKAAVRLLFGPRFVVSSQAIGQGLVPVKLEMQDTDGITVSDIKYPRSSKRQFAFEQTKISVNKAGESLMTFRLHAAPKTSLGLHMLNAKLTFQVITDAGISGLQQLDVQLPVKVVGHNAKVQRGKWPSGGLNRAQLIMLILLVPVLLPFAIPALLICAAVGPSKCQD